MGVLLSCHLLQAYNERQVAQLTRLIEITCTELSKADRQKVRRGWASWPACLRVPCCSLAAGSCYTVVPTTASMLHPTLPPPPAGDEPHHH